jgi:two-component system phosphate regulon response regulator PhoB
MNGQTAKILIVEDEEPLTLLLRYNLESEGYQVDAVARGDDADTRLKESVPDLVVLDWMLPGCRESNSAGGCGHGPKRSRCRSSC